ncbi:hypothetical protein BOX15_Mlig014128g1 [Macrostomum lignano]|uniref:Protein kinase domain-containing protein n=1 Tax=Macrostomum lignano TaxID=282301 RepID=A0A267GIL8_9PLAT|nr:hypothetical protein BOX15_Mlig014128g1 [Macrostomum lignano]
MESRLAAALEAGDNNSLLQLFQEVDNNLTIAVGGYKTGLLEQSLAHHIAYKSTDLQCFRAQIEKLGPECLTCTDKVNTPVHCAAVTQDASWMKLIYETLGSDCFRKTVDKCGCDTLMETDEFGDTPVHLAAWKQGPDSLKFIKGLLGPSGFHFKGCYQRTLIHYAAMKTGNNYSLKWLVDEQGSDTLNVMDATGYTPVHLAAQFQGSNSMQFIEAKLGPDCFHQRGKFQRTAIHCAAINAVSNSALKWLVEECGTDTLSVADEKGNTPVHYAAAFQNSDSMQFFKAKIGLDCFHWTGQCRQTAIHSAAANTVSNSALKWLADECGSEILSVADERGNTPVHFAAMKQGSDSMQFLKGKLGLDCFYQPGQLNRAAIHMAAMNEISNTALKWLVGELGSSCLLEKDSCDRSPVHLVAQHQDLETLRFVRDCLGDCAIKLMDADKKTVADYARMNKKHRDEMLKWISEQQVLLCQFSLDPNFSNWDYLLTNGGQQQLLGQGGFGKVFKAFTDKQQTVAVKIVHPDSSSTLSSQLSEAMDQEKKGMEILRGIRHTNVVLFLKTETTDGEIRIFTELIAGHSLLELMQRLKKPFDELAVRKFSQQVCSTLIFLHGRNPVILHRDIKCSNIMLTYEGIIKLIDFGLAKEIITATSTRGYSANQLTTVHFMAPELLNCENDEGRLVYTRKTDVWAFGCTVFEMLTMKPPNSKVNWMKLPARLSTQDMPDLPPEASDNLRYFYRRCVTKNPKERADAAELLRHPFLQSQ